ncbi:PKD domain-containing protein [Tepidanaerobacter acetatoxydans]|uniref:PKD domain-containing protein n=1 Tax=Tepidanaerobacter acetatoxydans TaxID=499229 RepID=UPI001BD1C9E9|nr:hypothetical protein [Tepidanaerobacter acetatoxydans]
MKKIVALALIFVMMATLVPIKVMADYKLNEQIIVEESNPNPIPNREDLRYSGQWDVEVRGKAVSKGIGVKNLLSNKEAPNYIFIPVESVDEILVEKLGGDWSFVEDRYSRLATKVGNQNTIYISFLAHLCGANPGQWKTADDYEKNGGGYQNVTVTPKPSASISAPSSVKEGESAKISVEAKTYVQFSHPAFTPATGLFADMIEVDVDIDGRQVHHYKGRQRNYSKTINYTFNKEGKYTLKLVVTDVVGRKTTTTKTINVTSTPPPPLPPGSISANIQMELDPSSIKEGKKSDVDVALDATRSRSSGRGPFDTRWWVKVNNKWVTPSEGKAVKGGLTYSTTAAGAKAGDKIWAKVRVFDWSLNKYDEAETQRVIMEEGEEPEPEPIPEDPPKPPPVPEPPVARFTMPERMVVGKKVKITNTSYDPDGPEWYGVTMECIWEISPHEDLDDKGLKPAGGYVIFNKKGVYKVTLTVIDQDGLSDTVSHNIEITNQPPVAVITAADEVIQGEEAVIYPDCYDLDGNLADNIDWTITPNTGFSGELIGNIWNYSTLIFYTPGEYKLTLTAYDTCGESDTTEKTILAKPAIPEAYFAYSGATKVNRKIVLDSSGSMSVPAFPVDFSKNEWEFIPAEGAAADDIKVVSSTDLKTRQVLFKKPGEYKIRLRVTNTAGNSSEWYEQILSIYPDEPPIADFYVQASALRDVSNGNKAAIELVDSSYSPDGDTIALRVWKYKYDSNNNGSFDDEVWRILDDGNNLNPVLSTDQVGKYLFELAVMEGFAEETIPEFIAQGDARSADTSTKAAEDKKCEVVNLQPVVDFEAITKPKVDLVVKGVTNSSWAGSFNSGANNLIGNISGKGFEVKRDVKLEQKETGTRWVQKGRIYFHCWGRPYSLGEWNATNYDIDNHEGDFGRILRYSSSVGSSNYDSLRITIDHTEKVPEDQYYPNKKPRLQYSSNGRNWKSVNVSYNGHYKTWTYTDSGKYSNREFGFSSDYIQDDIRYIRVRDSKNNASENIVGVNAKAYGYDTYTIYTSLDDDKFTRELNYPWQNESSKYVVLVSDCSNNIRNVYDIVNEYILKGIKVVFVGTSGLRTVGNQIAEGTDGTFIEFDGRNVPWDRIEEYLTDELQKQKTITQTVLLNEEVEIKTYYNDPENDPKCQERWKYTHNPLYYENSMGLASFADKYIGSPVAKFDKVGKYDVLYQARDNPKNDNRFDEYRLWSYMPLNKLEIHVHRKPIAQFTATLQQSGSAYNITLNSTSYDLDRYSEPLKGIVAEEWKWKDYNSTTWNSGKPYSISSNKKMLVSLRVKDKEGVWSDPYIKELSTAAENLPPVAQFTATPSTQIANKPITITDQSYDPNGDPIAEWQWRVKKPNGSWVSYGGSKPADITSLGIGTYTIELKVRDNPRYGTSMWSEPYTQTVAVIQDNNKPVARFAISPNPIIADEPYNISDTSYDSDGDPIVAREWKIQKPNGTWVNIAELKPTFEEMGLDDDGTYTVGLRVKDDPTRRNPVLSPYWSDWYYQTVTVESPLKVIGGSDKDVYRAGQALLLNAETEGKAFKVEAKCWWNHNEYTSTNTTTLVPDRTLSNPPQKEMTWHSRRERGDRDIIVIIPMKTADGTYPVKFTAYKRKADGSTKTAEDIIYVKVKGTIYDYSHSEIIGK